MNVDTPIALFYHIYNSLFLSLPFHRIEDTGTHLALFSKYCKDGFEDGKSPLEIIETYWDEYMEKSATEDRLNQLFHFVQYAERQVVLFDSVEDALFRQTHDMEGAGSVKQLLSRLDSQELKDKLIEKLRHFSLRLVLTAHPTQFYPGKVLGIINDLGNEIREHNPEQIRLLLMQLGKTAFVNREKPTPYDEAISLGWFLEYVFFHTLPDIIFRLLRALDQDVTQFNNAQLLALGFWPGGDRDGNPFVKADTTLSVAQRLREGTLRCYYRDIRLLKRRLTFRGVEEWISLVENKIYNTLYKPDEKNRYASCSEMLDDLGQARKIIIDEHGKLFLDDLDRFILKVRVFGFYFASLDIRQESRKHKDVWAAVFQHLNKVEKIVDTETFQSLDESSRIDKLLAINAQLDPEDFADEFVKETLLSFKAIADIQKDNGESGCHRYIISNCQSALNVAEVLGLAQLTIADPDNGSVRLDVVPLFESIDDLDACGEVMQLLYSNKHYARHLAGRGNIQHVMLGFSDGTKDGGYLRANWSIYCAKEALTRVSRDNGVTVVFFDGRGGPPGRGGGNNASYYASHGQGIENHAIQVTIQGQTVSSSYGTHASAAYNIERLLTAGLENHIFPDPARELAVEDRRLFDALAETAYQSYLELKNHRDFVPYLEKMTPLRWYGDTNIASRPTKRGAGSEIKFEDLRAIPFVGAWAQMKQNVPGYYGLGSAIEAHLKDAGSNPEGLYRRNLFFRTLLENSMQSLLKSNFDLTRYLGSHPRFGVFWKMLHDEYEKTYELLGDISGKQALLTENPTSRVSIELREAIVLPLIAIQQYALQKLQEENLPAEDLEICRKLVLRAMFGIINAARNAA